MRSKSSAFTSARVLALLKRKKKWRTRMKGRICGNASRASLRAPASVSRYTSRYVSRGAVLDNLRRSWGREISIIALRTYRKTCLRFCRGSSGFRSFPKCTRGAKNRPAKKETATVDRVCCSNSIRQLKRYFESLVLYESDNFVNIVYQCFVGERSARYLYSRSHTRTGSFVDNTNFPRFYRKQSNTGIVRGQIELNAFQSAQLQTRAAKRRGDCCARNLRVALCVCVN